MARVALSARHARGTRDAAPSARTEAALLPSWLEPLLLALVLAVWFGYELGGRALWSPDEGRYAEIPREMVASGDYLTPRLNGVKYFEKPPLVYWLVAGAIKTLGLNEWAVRLWPALFALLGCLALYYVGRELYGRRVGLYAAGVLALSPLYDFMGGILTLDMPLAAELTAALGMFLVGIRAPPGMRRRLVLYGFYACVAAAVLTKGLVGAVIPAMAIGAWILVLGEWRLLREIYLPSGLLIFFSIAAPWHVLVWQANPEFGQFYFIHEHLERYLTTAHQRYQPVWFFIPILLVGMYPWTAFLPYALRDGMRDLWRDRKRHGDTWFLLLWAGLPFVFFSLSSSKLIPYVLPVFPPLALLLGRWLAQRWEHEIPRGRGAFVALLVLGAVFAAALFVAPHVAADRPSVARIGEQLGAGIYLMAGGLLLAGLLPFLAWLRRDRRMTLAAFFVGAAVLVASFDLNFVRLDVGRSVKELALRLKQELKPGDEVITYETYYQDLPVYLERRVTVVDWKGELEFGTTIEDTRAWMIEAPEFQRRWNGATTAYLLTSRSNYDKLRADPPGPMRLLAQTAYAVLLVNREATP
jgi:4-amino-4-deoxy-L-arabinose transferase-like glycosyltransferase